ncbi:glycosyltransferase [Novosphingobium sp.]|uniref:glycosyltransferase family 2 protein n=1 Tax=Novosphingobium sp. TaxID=1874826 RepID=UPI0033408CF4
MTTHTAPAISVVMAAYNGAGLIEDTIASVLAQTCADFEVIVCDDASTDDTLQRLRAMADPRLVVIAAPVNGGPVVARNLAFAQARGRYIVGLDQDDLCHPHRFATQLAYLETHPDTVLVASAVDLIEAGTVRPPRAPLHTAPALIDWRLQLGNPLVWSSVMLRAEAARSLDVFERTDRRYAEDFDLYHRLAAHGTLARIDQPLVTYRIHPGGASQRYTRMMEDSATAVLVEAHGALFGPAAHDAARLVLIHFTAGVPVPDQPTLLRLNQVLGTLHDRFMATRSVSAADCALIMDEYARLWWRMADASVRAGALTLDAAAAACPAGLRPHHPAPARAASSAAIGAWRALRLRWRASAQ